MEEISSTNISSVCFAIYKKEKHRTSIVYLHIAHRHPSTPAVVAQVIIVMAGLEIPKQVNAVYV